MFSTGPRARRCIAFVGSWGTSTAGDRVMVVARPSPCPSFVVRSVARPLLLGEAPGPSASGDVLPLGGGTARRLLGFMGVEADVDDRRWQYGDAYHGTLSELFELSNVFPDSPGFWDPREARSRVAMILAEDHPCAVLLGRRVSAAAGIPMSPFFEWREALGKPAVVIPHPSGRNLLYNDPEERVRAGRSLWEAVNFTVGDQGDA